MDMVQVAEQGLGSVLAKSPDLFRHTFRRGELYNAASSSRGVQCQLLAPTSAAVSSSGSSQQLRSTSGPAIYRHLRAVCMIRLIVCILAVGQNENVVRKMWRRIRAVGRRYSLKRLEGLGSIVSSLAERPYMTSHPEYL